MQVLRAATQPAAYRGGTTDRRAGGGQSEAPRVSWSRGAPVASGATIRGCRAASGGARGGLLGGRAHLWRSTTARAKLLGAQRAPIHEDLFSVLEPEPPRAVGAAHLLDRRCVLWAMHSDRGRRELASPRPLGARNGS